MAMASVRAIPNVHVGIGRVNELHPDICSNTLDSIPIGITTHTHTQRFINARAGTKIAVCLQFSFNQQQPEQTFPGNIVEVTICFDGAVVSHTRTHVNKIARHGGELWFDTFTDLNTNGSNKRAEFRNIGNATSTAGEDHTSLPRAKQVGKIEVEVSYGKGDPVGEAPITPFALQHVESYSLAIRKQIDATHFLYYASGGIAQPNVVVFDNCTRIGRAGHYTFFYGKRATVEQIKAQLNSGITNANSNINPNTNVNTNYTSTTNPPNPGTSTNPSAGANTLTPNTHQTPGPYPAYGVNAYGRQLPYFVDQGTPAGHIYTDGPPSSNVDRSANTRPGISSPAITGQAPRAQLAQRGGDARAPGPDDITSDTLGRWTAGGQNASRVGAASALVPSGASVAPESQAAANQNISQSQAAAVTGRGHGSSVSNAQRHLRHLNNTIIPPNTAARLVPPAETPYSRYGYDGVGYSRSSALEGSMPYDWPLRRTPAQNATQSRHTNPSAPQNRSRRPAALRPAPLNANTAPADDHDDSSSSSSSERPTTAGNTTTLAPQNGYRRFATPADLNHAAFAVEMAAELAASTDPPGARVAAFNAAMDTYPIFRDGLSSSSAGPTTASQRHAIDVAGEDADAGSSNDNTTTSTPQNRSRRTPAPDPLGVRERDARVIARVAALRTRRAFWLGRIAALRAATEGRQDGTSSSSAGPTPASQSNVIDPTGGDDGTATRNDNTNTSAPQTGHRRGAAPPPAEGGQSYIARAVAAHEAGEVPASWAHNADMAAMYAGGQGGSGSGSSWSPASSSSASSSSASSSSASSSSASSSSASSSSASSSSASSSSASSSSASSSSASSSSASSSSASSSSASSSSASSSSASSSSASSSSARPTTASQGHVFDPTGEGYVARSSDDEKPPRKKRKLGGSEECSAKK